MDWDFSIYPEMTEAQKRATFSIGITLLSIQSVEQILEFCLRWVFPSNSNLDLKSLYVMATAERKRTLGQAVNELRKRVDVHAEFDSMLNEFVSLRNRFVHQLFNEPEFNLATDKSCEIAGEIMKHLQALAWDIQRLVMAYNILWTKHSGIPEVSTAANEMISLSKHLQQVDATFQPVLHPKLPE
jgi:hypothetical protein